MSAPSKSMKPVQQQLTPFGAALAGALGACFSNAVVYPLDVAKTRIQAASSDVKGKGRKKDLSMLPMLLRVLKEEGIAGWYKGFAATMINTFSMQYAYFFFYSFVRTSYIKRLTAAKKTPKPVHLSTAAELFLGALAGALAQIFTIPVSVIATRQQIGRSCSYRGSQRNLNGTESEEEVVEEGDDSYDDSFLSVARSIIREEGITGLWLGIKPGLVLTVNPAITYGLFERVKSLLILARMKAGAGGMEEGKLSPGLAFIVGALSKTLATVVTYPYIFAKVRIQARSADFPPVDVDIDVESLPPLTAGMKELEKGREQEPGQKHKHIHPGAITVLAGVLKRDGVRGWYQGMSAQIIKAVLAQALLFMSKEKFERWAVALVSIFSGLLVRARRRS